MKKLFVCLFSVIFFLIFMSCDKSELYNYSYRIGPQGWHWDDELVYTFDVEDTTSTYTCFVDIRNTTDYIYSNVYLSMTTIYPQGEVAVDTNLEFKLAMPDGQWLGRNNGRFVSGRYPLCRFNFPEPGTYQIKIGQAMRDTVLVGINDVGIVIKR